MRSSVSGEPDQLAVPVEERIRARRLEIKREAEDVRTLVRETREAIGADGPASEVEAAALVVSGPCPPTPLCPGGRSAEAREAWEQRHDAYRLLARASRRHVSSGRPTARRRGRGQIAQPMMRRRAPRARGHRSAPTRRASGTRAGPSDDPGPSSSDDDPSSSSSSCSLNATSHLIGGAK